MHVTRTAAALLIPAALLLAGCGSPDDASTGAGAVTAVPAAQAGTSAMAATKAAGSARTTGTVAVSYGARDFTATIDGVVDFADEAAESTITTSALGSPAQFQQRVVDGVGYLQLPRLGGSWVVVDSGDMKLPDGALESVEALRSVVDVEESGTGEIDGVPVTNYRGTVDVDEAAAIIADSGIDRPRLDAALAAGRLSDIPFTFSVDEQGRVVRAGTRFTAEGKDGTPVKVRTSFQWSDFGVAADIQAPPAEDILDIDIDALLNR